LVLKESLRTRTRINIILTSLILPLTMTMPLQLEHDRSMVLIFAYAPTFLAADDDKEDFYDCLSSTIRSVPLRHRLLLLGTSVFTQIIIVTLLHGWMFLVITQLAVKTPTVHYYWKRALNMNWL